MSDERQGVGRLTNITIDARDPQKLAEFWGSLLGVGIHHTWGPYVFLERLPSGLEIEFQRVAEPKNAKNRVHLDIRTDDLDQATDRAVALGARLLEEVDEEGHGWNVMADPEGNEFCLLRPRPTS